MIFKALDPGLRRDDGKGSKWDDGKGSKWDDGKGSNRDDGKGSNQNFLLTAGLMLALSSSAAWADIETGKKLHDKQCMECHDTSVYTRSNRFVTSREALMKQVNRCELNVGAQWFKEDIADVVQYLDETFYKFK
jgi:nucleoside-specific outer membrane channel protein Tsx